MRQNGYRVPPLRNRYFTTIKSSSVRTVADRHRLVALLTSFPGVPTPMTSNDLKIQKNSEFS